MITIGTRAARLAAGAGAALNVAGVAAFAFAAVWLFLNAAEQIDAAGALPEPALASLLAYAAEPSAALPLLRYPAAWLAGVAGCGAAFIALKGVRWIFLSATRER